MSGSKTPSFFKLSERAVEAISSILNGRLKEGELLTKTEVVENALIRLAENGGKKSSDELRSYLTIEESESGSWILEGADKRSAKYNARHVICAMVCESNHFLETPGFGRFGAALRAQLLDAVLAVYPIVFGACKFRKAQVSVRGTPAGDFHGHLCNTLGCKALSGHTDLAELVAMPGNTKKSHLAGRALFYMLSHSDMASWPAEKISAILEPIRMQLLQIAIRSRHATATTYFARGKRLMGQHRPVSEVFSEGDISMTLLCTELGPHIELKTHSAEWMIISLPGVESFVDAVKALGVGQDCDYDDAICCPRYDSDKLIWAGSGTRLKIQFDNRQVAIIQSLVGKLTAHPEFVRASERAGWIWGRGLERPNIAEMANE
jgi:hypothetical protein